MGGVNYRPNEPPTKPAAIGILADGNYGGSLGGSRYLHERDSRSGSRRQSAAVGIRTKVNWASRPTLLERSDEGQPEPDRALGEQTRS